jgi:hypothetical protein
MNGSKKALKALVAAAALAIPVGLAIPAQATTSQGCTVTPVTPIANGVNGSNIVLVDYKVNVSCAASALSKTVYVTMQRWEADPWPSADDLIGTSTYSHTFPSTGGSTSWTVTGTLPNWDGALDNFAEIYQGVHFAVKSNGVTSPYTNYQYSAVRSIHQ